MCVGGCEAPRRLVSVTGRGSQWFSAPGEAKSLGKLGDYLKTDMGWRMGWGLSSQSAILPSADPIVTIRNSKGGVWPFKVETPAEALACIVFVG